MNGETELTSTPLDSLELFNACQIPCRVVLTRLPEEEVRKYLPAADERPERAQKRIAKRYLLDVPRVDFGLFDQYKKTREAFFKKRKKITRNLSAEIGDFSFSSNEDVGLDSDYSPEDSSSYKKAFHNKKRRKVAYEEDDDWNPEGKAALTPRIGKKNLRNLRVNTRRKRIESDSSSDAEDFFKASSLQEDPFTELNGEEARNEIGEFSWAEETTPPPSKEGISASFLSHIVQEMEDFHREKSSKKQSGEEGDKPRSRLIKTICEVRKVVKNMVNTVCSVEKQPAKREVQCRWCDTAFSPEGSSDLCKICKDLFPTQKAPRRARKSNVKRGSTKIKIKSKVLKNLPKYEQQRLMYGEKSYNHLKSFVTPKDAQGNILTAIAEVHVEPADAKQLRKGKSTNDTVVCTVKKARQCVPVGKTLNSKPSNSTEESGKKSLFKIAFPSTKGGPGASETEVNKMTKQSAVNNIQYGTYLLPPVPTVVVANYAATDAKNGDYYLSSVYYQSDLTQTKTCTGKSEKTISSMNALPSMPSMEELSSMPLLSNMPPLELSHKDMSLCDIVKMGTHVSVHTQMPLPPSYSTEQQAADNPHSQILPSSLTADISNLFSNPQLQIQPLGLPNILNDQSGLFESEQKHSDTSNRDNTGVETPQTVLSSDPSSKCSNSTLEGEDTYHLSTLKPLENTSKKVKNSKSGCYKEPDHLSEETSEEDISSEVLFRKMSVELDAIGILGVVDLDPNPKWSLERIIEANNVAYKQLEDLPMNKENAAKLKQSEESRTTLLLAKSLLNRFGSFSKLSLSCLMTEQILKIKKEKNLEQESIRSSCQFSQSQPAFASIESQPTTVNYIASIETQINSIPSLMSGPAQCGTVHHFPAPSIPVPRSESRDTPSRGSGPMTPARPESATSQAEELTPAQIKKERMEGTPPLSQCSFVTPPAKQPSFAPSKQVADNAYNPALHPLAHHEMVPVSNAMLQINSNPTNSASNTFIFTQRNPAVVQYHNRPEVTANADARSLMNFTTRHTVQNSNASHSNVVFKTGQMVNVQQVYLPQGQPQRFSLQQPSSSINAFNLVSPGQTNLQNQVMMNNMAGQATYSFQNPVPGAQQAARSLNPSLQALQHIEPSGQPVFLVQNKPTPSSGEEQMFCAHCGKPATLRCKQCAKIAYCDTRCAKTYWHSKHKGECKPITM